jgi:hypothetical protein
MSWLFPLYLLGAGAVIAPILLHLRKKPPQDRIEISSLMFLDPSPRQPVRNRRLDHWLLLLLRCFVLLVLALMFARPWFRETAPEAAGEGESVVILIDKSASMHRESLWSDAVDQALAIIDELSPNDACAVALFDHAVLPVWRFSDDASPSARIGRRQVIQTRLTESAPGWQRTDLGTALATAAEWLAGPAAKTSRSQRVELISDLQTGASLEALRSFAWPESVAVTTRAIRARETTNLGLAQAASAEPSAADEATQLLRFRLENSPEGEATDFSIRWTDGAIATEGHLPPGVSRILSIPTPSSNVAALSATLIGDTHDFDNVVFLPPSQPNVVEILLMGSDEQVDKAASPLFYLKRALQPADRLQPKVRSLTNGSLADALATTSIAFLTDRLPNAAAADSVASWIRQGGFLVAIARPETETFLQRILDAPDLQLRDAPAADYRMLARLEETHPMMAPFRDARLRDFTKVRFWKHRQLEGVGGLQVLASFDNGDPALLTTPVGKGSLVLFTSGWHPDDSQLALSTKFVPLLFGLLEGSGHGLQHKDNLRVGEAITLHADDPTRVLTPSGETVHLKVGDPMIAEEPGFFKLQSVGGGRRILAANLAPEESRTTPMDPGKLTELGVIVSSENDGSSHDVAVAQALAASEREAQQRLWWFLLLALLALLGGETWVANKSLSRTPSPARA